MKNTGVNVHVRVCVRVALGSFPDVEPLGRVVTVFTVSRDGQAVPHAASPFSVPTGAAQTSRSLRVLANACDSPCLVIAALAGVKWPLVVVSICVSLVAGDVKRLFMCGCPSPSENCLFEYFAHVVSEFLFFLLSTCKGSFYFLNIT